MNRREVLAGILMGVAGVIAELSDVKAFTRGHATYRENCRLAGLPQCEYGNSAVALVHRPDGSTWPRRFEDVHVGDIVSVMYPDEKIDGKYRVTKVVIDGRDVGFAADKIRE